MPIIVLKANKIFSEKSRSNLVQGLSEITEQILRKNREVIVIRFEIADQQKQWYLGNSPLKDDEAIFELSIKVTKGTNTEREKADWIAEAWKLANEALGSAPYPNYISIQEIDETSWGYNGFTQAQRKIQLK